MPAIANDTVASNVDSVGAETTWQDAGCTSGALTNAVDWLVLGIANHRNEGSNDWGSQVEFRHGTTRLGLSSYRQPFGVFNTGDDAGGGIACVMARVTGNGSDTLNMRRQSTRTGTTCRVGGKRFVWLSLDDLGTENTDWWWVEGPNSEAAQVTPSGTTWVRGPSSGEITFTPGTTEGHIIVSFCEGFFTASATSSDEMRVRLRLVTDPSGSPSEQTIAHEAETRSLALSADPDDHELPHLLCDVRPLTASTQYRLQWEFANATSQDQVSYRRMRHLVIRAGALQDYDVEVAAGGIQVGTGEVDGSNDLSFNFDASAHDVLLLGCATIQNDGSWGQLYLRHDPAGTPTNFPPDGRLAGTAANGLTTADDFCDVELVGHLSGVTGAQVVRMVGQSDGSPTITYGRNHGNTADQRSVLIALRMDTPAAGTTDPLASSNDADADLVATMRLTMGLSAEDAADADLSATMRLTHGLTSANDADASLSASLRQTQALVSDVDADADLAATLQIEGTLGLASGDDADADVAATMRLSQTLQAANDADAEVLATMRQTVGLAANDGADAQLQASLVQTQALAAANAATSALSATLRVSDAMAIAAHEVRTIKGGATTIRTLRADD